MCTFELTDFLSDYVIDMDFLNLFINSSNKTSLYFISDYSGNVLYSSIPLSFENPTLSDLVDLTISSDVSTYLFKPVSFLNSDLPNLYCVPYNFSISNCIYFWVDMCCLPFSDTSFQSYLNKLVFLQNSLDSSFIISISNNDGNLIYVNDNFCSVSKYSRDELLGSNYRIINSGYHPNDFFENLWRTISVNKLWNGEFCNKAKDGSLYWLNTTIVPYSDVDGSATLFMTISHDITDMRNKLENHINDNLSNEFLENIQHLQNCLFKLKKNNNGDIVIDILEGKIASDYKINTYYTKNVRLFDIFEPKVYSNILSNIIDCFNGESSEFDFYFDNKTFLININPVIKDGEINSIVGSVLDISEIREKENKIYNLAYFDSLTHLPNRIKFKEFVQMEIGNFPADGRFAVLFLDLDRFKSINDIFGHSIGDELLVEVSERLSSYIRSEDILSRFGGDEFLLLVKNIDDPSFDFINYINGILKCFSYMYTLPSSKIELFANTSIGISVFPDNGLTYDELVKKSDTAMYHSKEKGKNQYSFYESGLLASFERRVLIESELRKGLLNNEFSLHYQPKISNDSCKVFAAEALIRWNSSKLGYVGPLEFIPIAEETGLINEIGSWVLETAIKNIYNWNSILNLDIILSINVSVSQLVTTSFISDLTNLLSEYPINTSYLNLEITESIMLNITDVKPTLDYLKSLGIRLSIDDFGTGYSSFTYLSNLCIDYLKIDQSFIRNLSENNKAIVKTIINLAHNMNIKTVAEGVETVEHFNFLLNENCDYFQGYYFSKPVDVETFEKNFLNIK